MTRPLFCADFCWMCLGDWKTHGSEYYECSRYKENPDIVNQSQQAQAREALKKYLFYFERVGVLSYTCPSRVGFLHLPCWGEIIGMPCTCGSQWMELCPCLSIASCNCGFSVVLDNHSWMEKDLVLPYLNDGSWSVFSICGHGPRGVCPKLLCWSLCSTGTAVHFSFFCFVVGKPQQKFTARGTNLPADSWKDSREGYEQFGNVDWLAVSAECC